MFTNHYCPIKTFTNLICLDFEDVSRLFFILGLAIYLYRK